MMIILSSKDQTPLGNFLQYFLFIYNRKSRPGLDSIGCYGAGRDGNGSS